MNNEDKKEYGLLIAKKSEKLVTAVYLVSDLMGEDEPIKATLRKISVELLSAMNTLAQPEIKDRITVYKNSLRLTTEILSLLHIARTTGLMSEMNSSLLIDGFRSLQLVLEKKQPMLTKEMLLIDREEDLQKGGAFGVDIGPTSYDALTPLSISRNMQGIIGAERRTTETVVSEDKEILVKSEEKTTGIFESTKIKKDIKGQDLNKGQFTLNQGAQAATLSSYQQKKVSRRDQIFSLFVKGVDVSIKDIASKIKGCSEKTIQRELNALVYDNKITRIGEKRWSRYLLK
jgi:hypothetical protein